METITEQREELFPLLEGEDEPLGDIIQVNKCFRTVAWYDRKITQLKEEQAALLQSYTQWFARRMAHCEQRIEINKQSLHGYMQQKDVKKVSTPEGTAFLRTIVHRSWPDDDSLVAWACLNIPDAIRIYKEPDKRAISEHIKQTGNIPDGYSESDETKLIIRF